MTVAQRVLLLILVSLLAAIGVVLLTSRRSDSATSPAHASGSQFEGPTMPPGLRAADFSLTDQSGRRVTLSGYRGKVVILTFIHSLCHDACPLMVEQIKGALNDLPAAGDGVPAIGISVAPAEDTRANRRRFLAQHEMASRMAFLSGSTGKLRPVWRGYSIEPLQHNLDHSTFVLLIDKQGLERVGFPADQLTPEGLAHDISVLEHERA